MSLYGALYAGVAGLDAQSNKLAVISDNIANVNTVGYKAGSAVFETLVTGASNVTAYSPGGVLGGNRQLVDSQGLLTTTTSPTDIAISGAGFFVVNQTADSLGQVLYTRAGSFTQDAQGNFINTAGFFLQAWPLDRNGLLPGEPGNLNTLSSANLSSLQTVNVQNLTGTAAATTTVALGANLNAGQVAFQGASDIVTMDSLDTDNFEIAANDIIVPTSVNSIDKGDQLTISTGSGLSYTYEYGGFTFGRNVTTAANGESATANYPSAPIALANDPLAVTLGSNVITVTHAMHGLSTGHVVTLADVAGPDIEGIPIAEINTSHVITRIDDNTYTITVTTNATGTDAAAGGAAVTEDQRPFAGNILDAITASQPFLGTTGTSGFTSAGLTFTITTTASGTATFTYTSTAPNAQLGQFNNLTNLASAISNVSGLTARVVNDRLYVGATDASAAVTFANGSTVGTSGPPIQAGIDWVRELGLDNVAAGSDRFHSMQSLADLVNLSSGLSAVVSNPLGAADVTINVEDPLDTINFSDEANAGSLLGQLGLAASLNGGVFVAQTTGDLGPAYSPTDATLNMASGSIAPQFSRPVTVFDSLGTPHNFNVAFLKTGINTWAVEIYAQPETDVNTALSDGLLVYGTIVFNGDGTLRSVDSDLTQAIDINWTNGATASAITFDWGTAGQPFGTPNAPVIGLADGLSQFNSGYNVSFVNQNGAPVGQLTAISIDQEGFITASYNNGETQRLYKIPLASFSDPNNLRSVSGNAFAQSNLSGVVNLKQAGDSGVGTVSSGALEASNVELARQLTDMIVAQRAYQANTKVISTADELLSALDQILR